MLDQLRQTKGWLGSAGRDAEIATAKVLASLPFFVYPCRRLVDFSGVTGRTCFRHPQGLVRDVIIRVVDQRRKVFVGPVTANDLSGGEHRSYRGRAFPTEERVPAVRRGLSIQCPCAAGPVGLSGELDGPGPFCRLYMRPLHSHFPFFPSDVTGTEGHSTSCSALRPDLSMVVRRSQPVQRRDVSDRLPLLHAHYGASIQDGERMHKTYVPGLCLGREVNGYPH